MSHDPTMRPIGMVTTIFGLTLNPLVSSSKNRSRPALDAGSGAPFFFFFDELTAGARCGWFKSVARRAPRPTCFYTIKWPSRCAGSIVRRI